jgi:hypothetical protein
MPIGYHFNRAHIEATEMTLHDGSGTLYATLQCLPNQPISVAWVEQDDLPDQFDDLDAAKAWVAEHADTIFGG